MAPPRPTRLRFSPAAQNDLENIWLYGKENWSVGQADHYIDLLKQSCGRILTMPELAPERAEFNPPVRIHPSGGHLLGYRISGECLDILRILGGKPVWNSILWAPPS